MFKDPFAGNGHVVQQTKVVRESVLHDCNYGFIRADAGGREIWMLIFDVPLGPGAVERVSVPFDAVAMGKFDDQFRGWRSGVELP